MKFFSVTFEVFGIFTHGKMAGKVNPKASSFITLHGDNFKTCRDALVRATGDVFFKPVEVTDWRKVKDGSSVVPASMSVYRA